MLERPRGLRVLVIAGWRDLYYSPARHRIFPCAFNHYLTMVRDIHGREFPLDDEQRSQADAR
jgi:hypothetical protein